jgi:hypothetical protein
MKKQFLLFFIMSSFFAKAQITIQSSDMPLIGDTLRFSQTSAAGLDVQTTGANTTWDFSQLVSTGQGIDEFKSSASVNPSYSLFFGLNSFGLKVIDSIGFGPLSFRDIYDFYKTSNTQFRAEGRGVSFNGIPVPSFYSDKDEIYQFPLSFGDIDSTTFDVTFSIPGTVTLRQYGSRVNYVDGWGRITTPLGTFDALRVRTIIYRTDSVVLTQLPFPIAIKSVNYEIKWLAKNQKVPVLQINGVRQQNQNNINWTNAKYRDIPRIFLSKEENDLTKINLYPNPSKSLFIINNLKGVTRLEVFDITGKLLMTENINQSYHQFGENLKSGIYFVRISRYNQNTQTIKVIKE